MSRHRNFRNIDFDDERNDYDDYSNSYEDHYSVSPSSAQFVYNQRDTNDFENRCPKLHDFIAEDATTAISTATTDISELETNPWEPTGSNCDTEIATSKTEQPKVIKANENTSGPKICYAGRGSGPAQFDRAYATGTTSKSNVAASPTFMKSVMSTPYLPNLAVDKLKVSSAVTKSPVHSRPESPCVPRLTPKAAMLQNQPATPRLKVRPGNVRTVLNLIVVGHVDAGKSTLMGHFLYLMGQVNQKTMHKYRQDSQKIGKGSFAYAWVLDDGSEERARGVTIDVARARFSTKTFDVVLLDAPGHKDFIPNMISGAAEADAAILVVNATTGEFETGFDLGGQTREHTMLVRSLGVSQLAVAVNKLDTVGWSQKRFDEICTKMKPFLKQTGFVNTNFVPCCGLSGENLIQKPTSDGHPLLEWYQGPTLLEAIDGFKPPENNVDGPLRLIVSDIFKTVSSSNPLISGKIESGSVQVNDKIVVMPCAQMATVKSLQIDGDSTNVEVATQLSAFAGDQVIVCLAGSGGGGSGSSNVGDLVQNNALAPGDVLCHPESPVSVVQQFQARVVFFNLARPVTKGFPVVIHCSNNQRSGFISKLVSQMNTKTGEILKTKPRCFGKNTSGIVEISAEKPLCLELYAVNKGLGRVMLRSEGATVAAGVITKLSSPPTTGAYSTLGVTSGTPTVKTE